MSDSARPKDLALLPAGFAIAFLASWCGIGGGLFAVPLLHYGFGLELRRAVATALGLVLGTTVAATATELTQPVTSLRAPIVFALLIGVLIGAQVGFAFAERLPLGTLRKCFVVVLFVAGLRVLFGGGGGEATVGMSASIPPFELAVVGAVGFGGGFLAPLLGVGGGLLMVPALFFLVPGLGFEGARASSLAAATLGAVRGLWLHGRQGRVETGKALSLGAGALGGAAAGVLALERWQAVEYGRILLGVVLCLVAVRFLVDLRRESVAPPATE